ncbi:hypothetical protein A8V23_19505 [Yersinia pestis]|uniref:Uncharacterized protein n=5 Tax=Yersinia pseudotuberculosis complex TaxID=1649845 RepID=Q74SC7_YERPE|nr:hypothetical protein YP_2689 [Yersinia pestis biovar Microtus str. 91001]ABG17647.1 hypothetical protein YPN_1317 [Yersinia pestis Nepal516]ABS47345.1 hypothetical protein YpsIP31758_1241 [Yersinia pseudotuberculosis IP 31758]ADV97941.1 hypothetical protein YPC_1303 [Yersinia pestis biovar Medievalis str. Harbin 35]AEL72769.1 hypothetical protein A1122_10630 [Yersinia pestis A1122]ANW15025.1 hypothetical protein BAY22_14100 [Yersinia pestis]EDM41559.1 hypothetical protein YPE_0208 [Yersini
MTVCGVPLTLDVHWPVKVGDFIADNLEIDGSIDLVNQMMLRRQLFKGDHFELILLQS